MKSEKDKRLNGGEGSKALVPFSNPVRDMFFNIPDALPNTHKAHITRIKNAYKETTYIDDFGVMWIEVSKLFEILRTNKNNASYIVTNSIPESSKLKINKKVYVRGYEIKGLIDKLIEEEGLGTKKQYLKYSEKFFNAIRDCDTAENIRNIYQHQLQGDRRKLKSKRIKKYKIKYDELTGEALNLIDAEFSHIRSYALFKDISNELENGLIVNSEVHNLITKKGVNDENELLELCKSQGWSIDWYNKYKIIFGIP